MDVLMLKFTGTADNNVLELSEYKVEESLKEQFIGKKANVVKTMKMKDVIMSNIADSFKVEYARYINFNFDNVLNTRKGNFPTKGDIIMHTNLLCYLQLNFVNLSYGNEFDFGTHIIYEIPVEFMQGEDEINRHFKFFIKYDGSDTSDDEEIILYLQLARN